MFSRSRGLQTGKSAATADGPTRLPGVGDGSARQGQGWQDPLSWVQLTYRARRVRDQLFDANLFAEPAWDMLLELYGAHLENRPITVADACAASSVPSPTAHRHIELLLKRGLLIHRDGGEGDARRVELSESAKASMHAMFLKLRALADSHPEPVRSAG